MLPGRWAQYRQKHSGSRPCRGSELYAKLWNLGVSHILRERIHWWIFVGNLMTSWATISFSRKTLFLKFRSITLLWNSSLALHVEINKLKSEITFELTGAYNWTYIIVTKISAVPKWSNWKQETKTSYLCIIYKHVTVFLLRAQDWPWLIIMFHMHT